jgi:hypothetical protein
MWRARIIPGFSEPRLCSNTQYLNNLRIYYRHAVCESYALPMFIEMYCHGERVARLFPGEFLHRGYRVNFTDFDKPEHVIEVDAGCYHPPAAAKALPTRLGL